MIQAGAVITWFAARPLRVTDGKANLFNTIYKPGAKHRQARHPFVLTTGRLSDQRHGMSRTATVGLLFGHVSAPTIALNPQDMTRRLLKNGELVHIANLRGAIIGPAQASPEVAPNQAFMAARWGKNF